jgi:HSP20 family protein
MSDNWDDWDCDNYEITVLNMEQSKYIEERKLVEESDNKIANQLFGFETDETNETDETDETNKTNKKQNSIANSNKFKPIREKVVNHPCDVQETDNGLKIEVAAIGLTSDEIEIIVDSETLRIAYRKTEDEKEKEKNEYRYLHRSIKKASFDIAWKISSKYDLQKLEAKLDKGLLTLDIPFAKENKPKKVTIK